MNIDNCNQLLAWLDAGAPHVTLRMDADIDLAEDVDVYRQNTGHVPAPDCGTVCCIAGAAVLMQAAPKGEMFPSLDDQERLRENLSWYSIQRRALHWLGLPETDSSFGHDLFDFYLAPENCTPAQAAQALRNVMAGKEPWA